MVSLYRSDIIFLTKIIDFFRVKLKFLNYSREIKCQNPVLHSTTLRSMLLGVPSWALCVAQLRSWIKQSDHLGSGPNGGRDLHFPTTSVHSNHFCHRRWSPLRP